MTVFVSLKNFLGCFYPLTPDLLRTRTPIDDVSNVSPYRGVCAGPDHVELPCPWLYPQPPEVWWEAADVLTPVRRREGVRGFLSLGRTWEQTRSCSSVTTGSGRDPLDTGSRVWVGLPFPGRVLETIVEYESLPSTWVGTKGARFRQGPESKVLRPWSTSTTVPVTDSAGRWRTDRVVRRPWGLGPGRAWRGRCRCAPPVLPNAGGTGERRPSCPADGRCLALPSLSGVPLRFEDLLWPLRRPSSRTAPTRSPRSHTRTSHLRPSHGNADPCPFSDRPGRSSSGVSGCRPHSTPPVGGWMTSPLSPSSFSGGWMTSPVCPSSTQGVVDVPTPFFLLQWGWGVDDVLLPSFSTQEVDDVPTLLLQYAGGGWPPHSAPSPSVGRVDDVPTLPLQYVEGGWRPHSVPPPSVGAGRMMSPLHSSSFSMGVGMDDVLTPSLLQYAGGGWRTHSTPPPSVGVCCVDDVPTPSLLQYVGGGWYPHSTAPPVDGDGWSPHSTLPSMDGKGGWFRWG